MSAEKQLTGYPSIDKPWLKYYSEKTINAPMPDSTLYEYIYEHNCDHGNDVAIRFLGKEVTYATMFGEIDRVAKAFYNLGIRAGDTVSFVAITTPEIIYSIYALNKIGAVCNMLDPRMSESTISNLVKKADSKYMVTLDMFLEKVHPLESQKIIALNTGVPVLHERDCGFISWDNFLNHAEGQPSVPIFHNQEKWPAIIEYTGGTTGDPKGVILSNDNINSLADQYYRGGIDLSRGHTWQTVSAPFIAYAFVFSMHFPLSYGMVCVITIYDPKTIAPDILANRYNHVAANPLVWETVIGLPEAQNHDFSHIIAPIAGADYMSAKRETEINDFLLSHGSTWRICQGYGLTEVASGVCINISNEDRGVGSVGLPLIDTTITAFDVDTTKEVKYGEIGEICISGPSIMLGYLKNEQATSEMIKTHSDGSIWLHSGDLGHIDENGFVFIDGRIKRMMVRFNGAKVFPPAIEKIITQHDAVHSCVVVGKPDVENMGGEVPVAFIILKEDCQHPFTHIKSELESICEEHLPDYALPKDYVCIDSYPRTPVGKVDYRALEREAERLGGM